MSPRQKELKVAGLFYLIFIIFSFLADHFSTFAQATTVQIIEKILSNDFLFSLGLVFNILSGVFFLLAAWALYKLLKNINSDYAFLFLILNLSGVVIQCLSVAFLFASKELQISTLSSNIYAPEQLHYLSVLFIHLYQNAFIIAQIFFGLWLLPLGYLIYKSKFLPKLLGILILVDCVAILLWFFQYFLFPDLLVFTNFCLLISLIAEVGLTLVLLFKRV